MITIVIIASVCIVAILLFPTGKKPRKKGNGNGTYHWESHSSMRIAQFADYIYRKLKDLIGG